MIKILKKGKIMSNKTLKVFAILFLVIMVGSSILGLIFS